MIKHVYIYNNGKKLSLEISEKLKSLFIENDFTVDESFSEKTELIATIGGDGTLLRILPNLNYPKIPIIGVNTGHMGFFQEFEWTQLEEMVQLIKDEKFNIQHHKLLQAKVYKDGRIIGLHKSINDVTIRNNISRLTHLNVAIGDTFIERFSGDGVIISTPVGSTAYNYSVGGAIVDTRLNVLQLSPIAPMNSVAFRSFTSSLMLPPDLEAVITPDKEFDQRAIVILDGFEFNYESFDEIRVGLADEEVLVARSENFDFWGMVKSKFLSENG